MKVRIPLVLAVSVLCAGIAAAGSFSPDSLVWKKCTGCHEPVNGVIPRVEEVRTTPEEWAVVVERMARLHGMSLSAGEMEQLLKELCATQMLRPDEEEAVAYLRLFNNTQHQEAPRDKDEERLFATCVRCHSFGKIASYRMTPKNWAKLRDFHIYMDPAILFQMREMHWIQEADAVLAYLAKRFPYQEAWKAPKADLSGEWVVLGYEPGKGTYRGTARWKDAGGGEASVAGTLSRARPPAADGDEEETAESPRGEALGPPARAPIVATVQPGDPVLTRPRVIRVWVARWEDRAGDLHDETYLYLRLDNGTWMLP